MATVAGSPAILWTSVQSTSPAFGWLNTGMTAGATPVLPVSMPHGNTLRVGVVVIGDPDGQYTFTGNLTEGSDEITSVSSTTGLVYGLYVDSIPSGLIPNDCQINAVSGSTVTVGGETPGNAFVSETGAAFVAYDSCPRGYLVSTVTPSTGVTITDYNFDGTTNVFNVGNGQAMSNYDSQAVGGFTVAFADAGSFSISVTFASSDPSYAGGTISPPLTVTVT